MFVCKQNRPPPIFRGFFYQLAFLWFLLISHCFIHCCPSDSAGVSMQDPSGTLQFILYNWHIWVWVFFFVLQIRDVYAGFRVSNFSIPDPRSKRSRIRIKLLNIFATQKTVSMLSEKWSGMFVPDPEFFPYPGFGYRIRIPDPEVKKNRIRIRNTDSFFKLFGSPCGKNGLGLRDSSIRCFFLPFHLV